MKKLNIKGREKIKEEMNKLKCKKKMMVKVV